MRRNYYYVSDKKYIMNQLERNGIKADKIDISDYTHVCETAEYIASLLDKKGLLYRECTEVVNAENSGKKKPFVFLTLKDMQYCFLSFDAVVFAISEYRAFERKFDFVVVIADKLTEEISDSRYKQFVQKKKYFGRIPFHPSEIHVFGKISYDGDKAFIQPIIIY